MNAGVTIASLLAEATQRIATANALEPREARLEARVLLAHALNVDHAWLIGHDRDIPTSAQQHRIAQLVHRRTEGEPIAYILGEREFYGRSFKVTPDVLIPRPETELLIETAIELFPSHQAIKVLDVGTGSGIVGITLALERPGWHVSAVDISDAALAIAHENSARFAARVDFVKSDVYSSLQGQNFDLVVSNPPYIEQNDLHLWKGDLRFEPAQALVAGNDGMDVIRRLVSGAANLLNASGYLLIEHGWQQGHAVHSLLHDAGFESIHTFIDLAGHPRVSGGQTPKSGLPVMLASGPQ